MEGFIPLKSGNIHFIRFGSGKKLLLAFHGFGEEAEKFLALSPALSSQFTVIAIDLPFHGKTEWKRGEYFMKGDLLLLISNLLKQERKERFSLMGYSLGGKIIMAAVGLFPSQIDEIILAAPDGVKNQVWYNLAVYPEWGRKIFLRFVKEPQRIFRLARMLNAVGIISDSLIKFLKVQTDTEEKRQKIYDIWTTIKDFETNLLETKKWLNTHNIKSYIFIGKYDKVITPAIGKKFSEGLSQCKFIVLEKGHNLITESLNEHLIRVLEA